GRGGARISGASVGAREPSGSTHAVTRVRAAPAWIALQCHSAIAPQPTIATRRPADMARTASARPPRAQRTRLPAARRWRYAEPFMNAVRFDFGGARGLATA